MATLSTLDYIVAVGLSMAIPLFAIGAKRCRGSPFEAVLVPLGAVLVIGVGTASVNMLPFSTGHVQFLRLTLVGAAAVLSVVSALRLHRLTSGKWSA
jgi:hypothetical protein